MHLNIARLSRTGKFGSIYFEEFPRKLFDI
nr:MAG TPA: hypothetical protein [Caudoviricetes sp.]